MIGIQIAAIIFALWMIYFTFLHFRRREFFVKEFILWFTLWIGLIVVVVFPGSVRFVLATFSISRTFDLVVIVALIILLGVTFRHYILIRRIERRIDELVRRESLHALDQGTRPSPPAA